jgi:hypothetical protein
MVQSHLVAPEMKHGLFWRMGDSDGAFLPPFLRTGVDRRMGNSQALLVSPCFGASKKGLPHLAFFTVASAKLPAHDEGLGHTIPWTRLELDTTSRWTLRCQPSALRCDARRWLLLKLMSIGSKTEARLGSADYLAAWAPIHRALAAEIDGRPTSSMSGGHHGRHDSRWSIMEIERR